MLYLNPNSVKIRKAKREFHSAMLDFVFKRIDRIPNMPKIKKAEAISIDCIFSILLNEKIDEVLIGEPEKLMSLNQKINPLIQSSAHFKRGVEFVFNYDAFTVKNDNGYDAYSLAKSLEIDTCPYCNRNYTNTVVRNKDKKKIARPQFDHYFDKGKNPLLSLSFYNLIPCCSICNSSIKGMKTMNLTDYLHPYLDNNIDDVKFTYKFSAETTNGLEIKVITPNPSKTKNTIEAFAIEEVYNSHSYELFDMIKSRQYFSDKYISILRSNVLKDVLVSKEDLYRIVFGTEYDSESFIRRPFSKFKNDILKELGII